MTTFQTTSSKKIFKSFNLDRLLWCITAALVVWYVILCSAHYWGQRPLWNDEECVLRSLKSYQAKQFFTQELMALQVFPRGYLFLIHCVSKPFEFNLLSLRFFPFIFMLGAFFVWLKIAGYIFKDRLAYLTFVLSWLASAMLIYYSAELKQYSMDVLAGALFILFIYNQQKMIDEKRYLQCGLILTLLPLLLWFSYISIFFLVIPLYNLVLSVRKDKQAISLIAVYGLSLLLAAALSYQFDIRWRPAARLSQEWHFIELSSIPDFFRSFGEGVMNLLSRWFVERPKLLKKIGIFFVVPGFIYMFWSFFKNIKKDHYRLKTLQTIAFVIFVEMLIFGALKKYPFTVPRTSLYFCPVILYLVIQALTALKNINVNTYRLIYSCYLIFLVYLMVSLSGIALSGTLTSRPVLW